MYSAFDGDDVATGRRGAAAVVRGVPAAGGGAAAGMGADGVEAVAVGGRAAGRAGRGGGGVVVRVVTGRAGEATTGRWSSRPAVIAATTAAAAMKRPAP